MEFPNFCLSYMGKEGPMTSPQGCMTHLSWDERRPHVLETRCAFCGHRPGHAAGVWWDGEYLNEPYPHVPLGPGRADISRGARAKRGRFGAVPGGHANP